MSDFNAEKFLPDMQSLGARICTSRTRISLVKSEWTRITIELASATELLSIRLHLCDKSRARLLRILALFVLPRAKQMKAT